MVGILQLPEWALKSSNFKWRNVVNQDTVTELAELGYFSRQTASIAIEFILENFYLPSVTKVLYDFCIFQYFASSSILHLPILPWVWVVITAWFDISDYLFWSIYQNSNSSPPIWNSNQNRFNRRCRSYHVRKPYWDDCHFCICSSLHIRFALWTNAVHTQRR